MEGALISSRRTAASAVLAASLLRSEPTIALGLLGCGPINLEIFRLLHQTGWAFERIAVYDLIPPRAETFAIHLRSLAPSCDVYLCETLDEFVGESDLISIATTAGTPHINDISSCRNGSTILHISLRDLTPNFVLQ